MMEAGTNVLDKDEAFGTLNSYLASGDWWLLISIEAVGTKVMGKIEEEFYSEEKNEDFELLVIPLREVGMVGIGLAKKVRLSPEKLSSFLNETGTLTSVTAEELEKRDILMLSGNSVPTEVAIFVMDYLIKNIGRVGKVQ